MLTTLPPPSWAYRTVHCHTSWAVRWGPRGWVLGKGTCRSGILTISLGHPAPSTLCLLPVLMEGGRGLWDGEHTMDGEEIWGQAAQESCLPCKEVYLSKKENHILLNCDIRAVRYTWYEVLSVHPPRPRSPSQRSPAASDSGPRVSVHLRAFSGPRVLPVMHVEQVGSARELMPLG